MTQTPNNKVSQHKHPVCEGIVLTGSQLRDTYLRGVPSSMASPTYLAGNYKLSFFAPVAGFSCTLAEKYILILREEIVLHFKRAINPGYDPSLPCHDLLH